MEPKESRRGFIKTSLRCMFGLYIGLLFGIRGSFEPPEIRAVSGIDVAGRGVPCLPPDPTCAPGDPACAL